jgi:hypothetical protein
MEELEKTIKALLEEKGIKRHDRIAEEANRLTCLFFSKGLIRAAEIDGRCCVGFYKDPSEAYPFLEIELNPDVSVELLRELRNYYRQKIADLINK